jgi:hypothetical protein
MRKFLIVLCAVFLVSAALTAQERTGNITGTVIDKDGMPLPGVNVTLTQKTIAAMTQQSNAEGRFRFLSLFPANDYVLKAELQGFKTKIEQGVIVNVGKNADIRLVMEQGALEEQVTVIAQTPVVQAKKTQITHTVNYDMLQSLPSARDPWVVLQMTPSIQMDRENIGGVESGQQSSFSSKGTTTQEWTIDGVQTTDRNSGGSPGYYDFDSFEEMNVSTGMLDVEHRDPGIVINLVTRRGGNRTSLGGRFYWTNEKFQTAISADDLAKYKLSGYDRVRDIKDFGFNAGGPIWKDKAWWWFSYGINQIDSWTLLNIPQPMSLNNYVGKINLQLIPENRAEFFYQAGDKKRVGRDSNNTYPPGRDQKSNFYFGNPTLKIQDEHMFGDNLFVSIRYGYSNAGFGLWSSEDNTVTKYRKQNVEAGVWSQSSAWFYSDRPHYYTVLQTQYFNDNLFGTGTSHEIKIGGEINNNARTYTGGNPGNFYVNNNYNTTTVDWNGDGKPDVVKNLTNGFDIKRIYVAANDTGWFDGTDRYALYFNDTITFGRFNINLGLRADYQKGWVESEVTRAIWLAGDSNPLDDKYLANYATIAANFFPADTLAKIAALIPQKTVPYYEQGAKNWYVSPRFGVNYDVFGNGKTILKLAYTLYRGTDLGPGYYAPYGFYGNMNFYWKDDNTDSKPQLSELYWAMYNSARTPYRCFDDSGNFVGNYPREYGLMWGGWDSANPTGLSSPTSYIAPDWKASYTHEFYVSVEREILQDFGASLSYSWRRYQTFNRGDTYYPDEKYPALVAAGYHNYRRTKDSYMVAGTIPDQLIAPDGTAYDMKEAAGKQWYVLNNEAPNQVSGTYTWYTTYDNDRYQQYWGWDLVLNKRLSHKWMFNASFTYQMEKNYYGANGYTDPTGMWAYEGMIYGISLGGSSGKISVNMFSRWLLKASALYQLPWDVNVSATLSAHEGAFVGESFTVQDLTLPNTKSQSNGMPTIAYDNRDRLGNVWTISAKVEKMIKLGDIGRMYLSADIFNVLNVHPILRQYEKHYGTFRFTGNGSTTVDLRTAPAATAGAYNEMMNPLLLRIGMRFQL